MQDYVKQVGYSLIEVLIAWSIVSIVLLSMIVLQTKLLQQNYMSYLQSIAVIQVNSMLERLQVNQSTTMRQRELNEWNQQNVKLLPQGKGNYVCQNNHCKITLWWHAEKSHQLSVTAIL